MTHKLFHAVGIPLLICLFLAAGCSKDKQEKNIDGLTRIGQELEQKVITKEEALIFNTLSVFNHPDCPDQYRTKNMNDYGTRLMLQIRTGWDSFSEETKKKLEPYYVSPFDPKSFINKTPPPPKGGNFIIQNAHAEPPPMGNRKYLETANHKYRIWFLPSENELAQILVGAFDTDRIHERESGFMGVVPIPGALLNDDKIDVFFAKNVSWWGLCTPYKKVGPLRKYASWIAVNTDFRKSFPQDQADKNMKSTLAHELFHSVQFAIDYGEESWWWWQEATSTWMEHYIYPKVNFEQRWIRTYFKRFMTTRSLTRYETIIKNHEYAAYLFPLYLAQKEGPYTIRNLWKACEPSHVQILDALNNDPTVPFENRFKEFALWFYNERPEKNFLDGSDELTNMLPDKVKVAVKPGPNQDRKRVTIEKLAFLFEEYSFTDPAVRSVDFSLEKMFQTHPDLSLWALVKVKGQTLETQDWSDLMLRQFCFDIDEEHLEKVTLIYVNHNQTDDVTRTDPLAEVTGYTEGCSGTLNLTWNLKHSVQGGSGADQIFSFTMAGDNRTETGSINVVFTQRLKDPGFPEIGKEFVPKGTYSFQGTQSSGGSFGLVGGPKISKDSKLSASGTGVFAGEKLSIDGHAHLDLHLFDSGSSPDIADDEMAMVEKMMPGIGDLLKQVQGMHQEQIAPQLPKKDELGYNLTFEINDFPAESTEGDDNYDMVIPLELKGVFKKGNTQIRLNKTLPTGNGNLTVSGTLKLTENISNSDQKEEE